ncbi:malonic semialdehyde reductase [Actinoplanes sp. NPDC051411]|jgi:3-hydroxypropanoate dehydrogenase|uniref:malonic semialdehyde reductase n=1 Tax=Actinoplanes sp. NPDC051411 TaxID=3155522 RepID=UPI00341C1A8A
MDNPLRLAPAAQDLLFRQARSVTEFTAEPVSDAQVAAIYELVKHGPTSFNQQPLRMIMVRSREARQRLLPHLDERNRRRTEHAPLPIILAADLHFHKKLPDLFPHGNAMCEALDAAPEKRAEDARYNALLQIGYLIVGVRAAGLAVCPMIGYDATGLDREFFPDGRLRSLLVMNIGTGLPKRYDRLPRLPYEEVVTVL